MENDDIILVENDDTETRCWFCDRPVTGEYLYDLGQEHACCSDCQDEKSEGWTT